MSTNKLSNIPLDKFRKFLKNAGCKHIRTTGGHEFWNKEGLKRSITLPTHKDPVKQSVVKNTITNLKLTKEEFFTILNN
jgi:predicted RNA binding protein YcfA (HicA-like mRNA interferase family)